MAFITQQGDVTYKTYQAEEDGDLEALIAGISESSQSTLLLKKRKELREVDDALEFMSEEFASRMKSCEERQKRFLVKQMDMKEQVAKFEKFIQENDAKKSRAENKAKQEAKMYEQACSKENTLRKRLEILKDQSKRLSARVTKLQAFPLFLERAVEASEGEYEEVNDMLNRHRTLIQAQSDLRKLVESGERENDEMRTKLNHLKLEQQNALLVYNSEIHRNQKHLEKLREESYKMELDLEQTDRYAKDRQRDLAQIINSVRNLNSRCNRTNKIIQSSTLLEMRGTNQNYLNSCLDTIMFRLNNLQSICRDYTCSGDSSNVNADPATQTQNGELNGGIAQHRQSRGVRKEHHEKVSHKSSRKKEKKSKKSRRKSKDRSSETRPAENTEGGHKHERRRSKSKKHKSKSKEHRKHHSKNKKERKLGKVAQGLEDL